MQQVLSTKKVTKKFKALSKMSKMSKMKTHFLVHCPEAAFRANAFERSQSTEKMLLWFDINVYTYQKP